MSFVIRVSALISEKDKILFVQEGKENYHYGRWNLPGGHLEEGEAIEQAVIREIKEETGLNIKLKGLIGIYTLRAHKHYFHYVFSADKVSGNLKAQEGEILDLAWMSKRDVELMADSAFVYPHILSQMLCDHDENNSIPLDYISEFQ